LIVFLTAIEPVDRLSAFGSTGGPPARQAPRQQIGGGKRELSIELKYHNGEPVIRELRRVSKPGKRIYAGLKELPGIGAYTAAAVASIAFGETEGVVAGTGSVSN